MTNKSLFRNDKVVLLKEYEDLKQVGNVYEVGNFTDELVVIREAKSKIAVGAIPISDFYDYFEKVEEVRFKFTEWSGLIDSMTNKTIGFYRTNHKKVQVKLTTEHNGVPIRAEASCNKGDKFDIAFGIHLAYARARKKALELVYLPAANNYYTQIHNDYKNTKNAIKNMLASLEPKVDGEDVQE